MAESPVRALFTQPGIKRDGTPFDGNFWHDGEHVRFRIGRPKKMGGYREVVNGLQGPASAVYAHSKWPHHQIYNFVPEGVECFLVDNNGVGGVIFDRTPVGFTPDDRYVWQYGVLFDASGGGAQLIIAHPGQNGEFYDQTVDTPVYYGDVTDSAALVALGESVSGGVCVLQPYLFIYGNDGLIKNSASNDPTDFASGDANTANVAPDKVVKGLPLRGGSSAPAGLFWSLSSLVKVSFVGGTAKWRYDMVTDQTSIIAPNAPVEYDGIYYWPGTDRFLMYNGVVQEVPNQFNQDFFFDNLNWSARARVWGTKVPRWGEIWWFFPRGNSSVCTHAVVYNVREKTWYDTPLARSAGVPPKVLRWPLWSESVANRADDPLVDTWRIYQHEFGVDHIFGEDQVALPSYVETSAFGIVSDGTTQGQADNVWTRITRVEPDAVQTGPMTLSIRGGPHARIDEAPTDYDFEPDTPIVDIRDQRRLPRLRITSNAMGGNYHLGRLLVRVDKGDVRE